MYAIRSYYGRVQEIQDGLGTYDQRVSELDNLRQQAERLRQEIDRLETRRHALQTRVDLFPVALEGQQAKDELAALENITDFPEHGLETIAAYKSEEKNLARQIDDERNGLKLTEQRLEGLRITSYNVCYTKLLRTA